MASILASETAETSAKAAQASSREASPERFLRHDHRARPYAWAILVIRRTRSPR